jgi:hypothetical protein
MQRVRLSELEKRTRSTSKKSELSKKDSLTEPDFIADTRLEKEYYGLTASKKQPRQADSQLFRVTRQSRS